MSLSLNFFHMGMSNRQVALRFMGIYEAQFRGLRQAGAAVTFSIEELDESADVFIATASAQDIRRVAKCGKPMALYVPPSDQWLDQELLNEVRSQVLFAFGPVLSDMTANAYREVGIEYHCLPFGADPELMRPLHLPPQYDIVFLGGLKHRRGYQPYIEPLLKRIPTERMLLLGDGWEKYNIPSQSVAYGPLVNVLYNLGRVCLNLHAPEQSRGTELQLDLNNRVYDLAMAGCVQVCDNPEAVRRHFSPTEVFAEATPEAWVSRVLESLATPDGELAERRNAARSRALADHTWAERGRLLISWITNHLKD